jgi:hypothetical protein
MGAKYVVMLMIFLVSCTPIDQEKDSPVLDNSIVKENTPPGLVVAPESEVSPVESQEVVDDTLEETTIIKETPTCPSDSKRCSDGSQVLRTLPDCTFPQCPHLVTAEYALSPGPNFVAIGLETQLDAAAMYIAAGECSPKKIEGSIISKERLSYSPTNRITYQPGKGTFPIEAGEAFLIWCNNSMSLHIEGKPKKFYTLERGENYFVTPPGTSISARAITDLTECNPTFLVRDIIKIDDGEISTLSGDSFKPLTQTSKGWIAEENELIFIRCRLPGSITFP